ncbi:MAG: hypothetical protein WCJ56_04940 [bacterium]
MYERTNGRPVTAIQHAQATDYADDPNCAMPDLDALAGESLN